MTTATKQLEKLKKSTGASFQQLADALKKVELLIVIGEARPPSRQHVARWMKGERNPDRIMSAAIAKLAASPETFFDRKGK